MMFKIVALLLVIAAAEALIVCPPGYCDRVQCESGISAELCEGRDQLFKAGGSWCGCCDVCLHKIREGQSCIGLRLIGAPPRAACEVGTVCDRTSWTCVRH